MRRRDFFATLRGAAAWQFIGGALGGSMLAGPSVADEAERKRRIGVLMAHPASDPEFQQYAHAFRDGLKKFGWIEGRNVSFEFRWGALDDAEVRSRSAKELVALQPDLILTQNTPPTASMIQQTRSIPIIFVIVADPVGSRFVQSLSKPGGNVTGFTIMEPTIAGRWLQLLKEIAPHVTHAALLFNPATAPYADIYIRPFKAAATSFSLEAISTPVKDVAELEGAIAAEARVPNGGIVVIPDGFLNVHRKTIVSLTAHHKLPAIYAWPFFPEIGGLMSYGSDQRESFRLAAAYADRILKGEKPFDLPVQAPTEYKLVINLETAKVLGLTVSQQLQQLADKLIE
jgi:putative tryptophan/tyrosine transport system substrate-binding protein